MSTKEFCNPACSLADKCIVPEDRADPRIAPEQLCPNIPFSKEMLPKGKDTSTLKIAWSNIEQALSSNDPDLLHEADVILYKSLAEGQKHAAYIGRVTIMSAYLPIFKARLENEKLRPADLERLSDSLARGIEYGCKDLNTTRVGTTEDRRRIEGSKETKGVLGQMVVFYANVNGVLENPERPLLYPSSTRERNGLDGKSAFGHDCYAIGPNGDRSLHRIYTVNNVDFSRLPACPEINTIFVQQEALEVYNKIHQADEKVMRINRIAKNLPIENSYVENQYFLSSLAARLNEVVECAPLVPAVSPSV